MKRFGGILAVISWLGAYCVAALAEAPVGHNSGNTSGDKTEILCSFFPVYLFTKNVVGDRPNVHVSLMIPSERAALTIMI